MNAKKLLLLTPMALLFMSAEKSCQQAAGPRSLKKIVQIDQIDAAPILTRDESFDYKFVANNQVPGILFSTGYFFHRAKMPGQEGRVSVSSATGDSGFFGVSKMVDQKAIEQLQNWYPNSKVTDFSLSQSAACMVSRPQYRIGGAINAMELWGGGKLQLGFNSSVSSALPLSASFGIDKARMALSMYVTNPLTEELVSAANVSAMKNDYSAKFGIDLGIIHLGPEFYRKTGMSEVTEKGLTNGINAVNNNLKNDPWFTRVFLNKDREIVIVGGAEINLMVGDQLKVVNESHIWRGPPCDPRSIYEGSFPTSREWTVEVVAVGDGFSRAKVINILENDNIESGAKVTVIKLYDPNEKKPANGTSTSSAVAQKVNSAAPNSNSSSSNTLKFIR